MTSPRLATAAQSEACSARDSGWYLHAELDLLTHGPVPGAIGAGIADDRALALTPGAGRDRHHRAEERALGHSHPSRSPTLRAGQGLRAGLRPITTTDAASLQSFVPDGRLGSERGLLESDLGGHQDVATPPRSSPRPPKKTPVPEDRTEKVVDSAHPGEDLTQVDRVATVVPGSPVRIR